MTNDRFWIADPSEHDTWADPRAANEWRIVDEDAGGTVAYAQTYEEAKIMLAGYERGVSARRAFKDSP